LRPERGIEPNEIDPAGRRRSPRERQALHGQPRFQDAIRLSPKRDDLGLLAMEPPTQGCNQQLERKQRRTLRHRPSIQSWDTTRS
jgi:hypothetical protein